MSEVTSNAPNGTPTWVDLGIPDLDRAMDFYAGIFGWEYDARPVESMTYVICKLRGQPVAGMMRNPDPEMTHFWWNVYFASDDVDGTVKRVVDGGGRMILPPDDVMDQGRMAVVADPVGAQYGLWHGRELTGARIVSEPGATAWSELITPQAGRAAEFYAAVFDYTTRAVQDDYTLLVRPDGHEVAGIWARGDVDRSSWATYFQVTDADTAIERATAAGGALRGEPWDSPYGRIAVLTDPFGAEFRVVGSPETASG